MMNRKIKEEKVKSTNMNLFLKWWL